MFRWKASTEPSADLPTTNWPPQARAVTVANVAPSAGLLAGSLPVSDPTRSHHPRVLREAGVTATRAVGTQRLVSLRRDDLDARFPGLLDAVVAVAAAGPA